METTNKCDGSPQFSWFSWLLSKIYRRIFQDSKATDNANPERTRIQMDRSL
uniref:Uncharacterized protein n=1 Tax=Arundo donax TaxID=35708 RepID=A0A0A8ZY35_ARUDO